MIIKTAEFIKSATRPSQYPEAMLPEIAFAGKSNVGKSSLINTLLNRKRLVKISSTPGRTQLLNFFNINDQFNFVDIPGYGYAKVPVSVRKKWGPMIETYLKTRETLRCVVLILDIRRTPGNDEISLVDWFHYHQIEHLLVLTKADKLSKSKQAKQHRSIADQLFLSTEDFIRFSAKTRFGKDSVWRKIETLLNIPQKTKKNDDTL